LILGDTLPYLRDELSQRFPGARTLSVYFHPGLPDHVRSCFKEPPPGHSWSPTSESDLRTFLRSELSEREIHGLLILEWPPSARAFPLQARDAARAVEQTVREIAGGVVTAAAFSRLWLDNLFANFLSAQTWYRLKPHHQPIVIAASGPSLRKAFPLISENRNKVYLIALPSSLQALAAHGLVPDLVITVDPGYWAQGHLHPLVRLQDTPVAMPLVAARGIWRYRTRAVLISSASFIEQELFRTSGISPLEISDTGTVAATAYRLSLQITDGPVVFAGLDLAHNGLAEHVHPHPFDTVFELRTNRISPLPSILFERFIGAGVTKHPEGVVESPALKTYAGWFRAEAVEGRTYRLFPSKVDLPKCTPLDEADLRRMTAGAPASREGEGSLRMDLPPPSQRKALVTSLLDEWTRCLRDEPPGAARRHALLIESLAPRAYLRFSRSRAGTPSADAADTPDLEEATLLRAATNELSRLRRRFLS
jgi:hypothetical protein